MSIFIYSIIATTSIMTYFMISIYKKSKKGLITEEQELSFNTYVYNSVNLAATSILMYVPIVFYYIKSSDFIEKSSNFTEIALVSIVRTLISTGMVLVILILIISLITRAMCYYITSELLHMKIENLKDIIFYAYVMGFIISIIYIKDIDFIMTLLAILMGKFIWFDTIEEFFMKKKEIKNDDIKLKIREYIKNNKVFRTFIYLTIAGVLIQIITDKLPDIALCIYISIHISMIISTVFVFRKEKKGNNYC